MTPSDIARFWAKVDRRGPDECWLWTGAVNNNRYGIFYYAGHLVGPHRFAKALDDAIVIPDWHIWQIDHMCLTKRCVNPAHLQWVPTAGGVNGQLHFERKFGDRTTCSNGHPWIEANLYRRDYGGRHYKACNICRRAASARSRERKGT